MKRTPVCSVLLLLLVLGGSAQEQAEQRQRERMVRDQIAARGVRDQKVLEAMREVQRHLFVRDGERPQAYADTPLPIGHEGTISQPYIVGYMTELLQPAKNHRILEIGAGSGYQAAVLARMVERVYTIEIVPELARFAKENLDRAGVQNVNVRQGDGYKGWPEEAPFDGIILTAAPPEIPQALIDQLKPGGRLVAPVGRSAFDQQMILLTKSVDGKVSRKTLIPVRFVPMKPEK
jgi:protein-L-isoaspartate(D-aspartate) O-methyltransferase